MSRSWEAQLYRERGGNGRPYCWATNVVDLEPCVAWLYSDELALVVYYINKDPLHRDYRPDRPWDRTHRFQSLRVKHRGILVGCRLRPLRACKTRVFVSSTVSWANRASFKTVTLYRRIIRATAVVSSTSA